MQQKQHPNRINIDPSDSCGVGAIVDVSGKASNRVLQLGVTALGNVTHRGAIAADGITGDGCGVLIDIPKNLLERSLKGAEYSPLVGVAVVFLPSLSSDSESALSFVCNSINSFGLRVIGQRDVPVDETCLGKLAIQSQPRIVHLFVSAATEEPDTFERKLFLARRSIELSPQYSEFKDLHIASLSCRKLVYKAMVQSNRLADYYPDLTDSDLECRVCIYHQRFSTNTAPTWSLCQPFRILAHNGEINTIRGNRNWMTAREASFDHPFWQEHRSLVRRLFNFNDSDSASLDNCVELMVLSGRSLPHVLNMLIPPAWENDPRLSTAQRDFYRFHSCFCEPWDGPAAVVGFDGRSTTAILDRNGLRPLRYKITKDDLLILGSEVGAEREDHDQFVHSGRLGPGQSISVDIAKSKIIFNDELKKQLSEQQPYGDWTDNHLIRFIPSAKSGTVFHFHVEPEQILRRQIAAGFTKEELEISVKSMAENGQEPTFSMGVDTPLAVLSQQNRNLSDFFKQRFAQVTNPPIDPIREKSGMSLAAGLGPERNILQESPNHSRVLNLDNPILLPDEFNSLKQQLPFPYVELDCTWDYSSGPDGLLPALDRLISEAQLAVEKQNVVLILTDKNVTEQRVAIPMLLAVGAVHHGLNKTGQRMMCSLVAETSEVRDSHQLALLFGYGCTAVYPFLTYQSIEYLIQDQGHQGVGMATAWSNYRDALSKGMLKIMSKMGISVLYSYQGAQIFEAIGIGDEVIDKCFRYSFSNIGGIGFNEIAANSLARHEQAFHCSTENLKLAEPGISKPKRAGEHHVINGKVTKQIHRFARENKNEDYRKFQAQVADSNPVAIRDLLQLNSQYDAISLDEVEAIEEIRKRFTTAAMSLGAISPEAHEALAVAMNEIGGKSNSGEGGEDPARFVGRGNSRNSNSRIKQVASGRFGVNVEYLQSADEIEIKMAQGAKPGEGGQLPGFKVNELIARLRNTSPGVTLISPPPHHDIYSIEDLAQLIFDLKSVNKLARICVKLVAKSGVGSIAVGVVKSMADVVLISGHEGGTGASPLTSIKHAGLPWEIGLAETHQNLVAAGLRNEVIVRADGGIRTGLDVIKAAILGAEEFNFGTMALIALGCVYVKKCHLNNCPVGIATQDPKYRSRFKGQPENLINYLNAVATECRELLAGLGHRTLDSIVGKTSLLSLSPHAASKNISLDAITVQRKWTSKSTAEKYRQPPKQIKSFESDIIGNLDWQAKLETIEREVVNTDRNIGTRLAAERTRNSSSLCIRMHLTGSAGQSLGAFLCDGIEIRLKGDANDYVGKGMSGGTVSIVPHENLSLESTVVAGNAVLYGATGGKLFAAGTVAERFGVRNSGATAVVEGCGDHGCEYMTRGIVVILGKVGNNFAAGMTGGDAFVHDPKNSLEKFCNHETVLLKQPCPQQIDKLRRLIEEFSFATHSKTAARILEDWEKSARRFKLVTPLIASANETSMHKKRASVQPN